MCFPALPTEPRKGNIRQQGSGRDAVGLWTDLGRVCLGAGAGRVLLCAGGEDELVGN